MNALRDRTTNWLLAAALGVTVALVFLPVVRFEFLRCWDDHTYILGSEAVREFKLGQITTEYVLGNYHPLTIFSYAVQYQLFHDDPAGYHVVNLIFHVINCLLVYWLISLLTKRRWTAVLTALLFGLHPLRVEPVAWISGQKDLLAATGIMIMMIAYCYYRPSGRRIMLPLSVIAYAAAALAKASVLFVPILLPVIDRLRQEPPRSTHYRTMLPYAVIALGLGVMAILARVSYQSQLGEAAMPVLWTALIAIIRLVFYFSGRIFLPDAGAYYLNIYYITRSGVHLVSLLVSVAVILILAATVVSSRKHTSRIIFGAVFFLAAILPALPAMNLGYSADRFTYLASVGILYVFAEYVGWLTDRSSRGALWIRYTGIIMIATIIMVMAYGVRVRLPAWRDCRSLTRYFTEIYPDDPTAWMNRGLAFADRLDYVRADEYYTRALTFNPNYALVYNLRGLIRARRDSVQAALVDFTRAVTIDPRYAEAWYNRGNLYYDRNHLAEAMADYTRAVELDATHAETFFNRGNCRARLGDLAGAIDDYSRTVSIDPGHLRARFNRARAYFAAGNYRSAYVDLMNLQAAGVPVDPAFVDTLSKLMR